MGGSASVSKKYEEKDEQSKSISKKEVVQEKAKTPGKPDKGGPDAQRKANAATKDKNGMTGGSAPRLGESNSISRIALTHLSSNLSKNRDPNSLRRLPSAEAGAGHALGGGSSYSAGRIPGGSIGREPYKHAGFLSRDNSAHSMSSGNSAPRISGGGKINVHGAGGVVGAGGEPGDGSGGHSGGVSAGGGDGESKGGNNADGSHGNFGMPTNVKLLMPIAEEKGPMSPIGGRQHGASGQSDGVKQSFLMGVEDDDLSPKEATPTSASVDTFKKSGDTPSTTSVSTKGGAGSDFNDAKDGKGKGKPKKKRGMNLSISVQAEDNYENISAEMQEYMKNQSTVITEASAGEYNAAHVETTAASVAAAPAAAEGKSVRKKPGLGLNIGIDADSSARVGGGGGGGGMGMDLITEESARITAAANKGRRHSTQTDTTVRVGDFRIRESGLVFDTGDASYRRGMGGGGGSTYRKANGGGGEGNSIYSSNGGAGPVFVSLGGSFNFIEINALGAGAGGTVVEALHIPTLTIVALKMLPCYNQQKRASIESELAVLYKNMAELRLVDESLEEEDLEGDVVADFSDKGAAGSELIPASQVAGTDAKKKKKKKPCPYLLALYDAFTNPKTGLINLVVEYMDGGALADVVKAGGCSNEIVLGDIAEQCLLGLKYLHSNGQMHRDIKPGNILLNCKGEVKLADFGISKAMDGTGGFANSFVGTVTYMSPERIIGETYGYPSDIWSFGVTLFTVGDGKFPFQSDDTGYWGMIKAVCDEPVPVPSKEVYSDDYRSFIELALQKKPEVRGTAEQLLQHKWVMKYRKRFPSNGVSKTPGAADSVGRSVASFNENAASSGNTHSYRSNNSTGAHQAGEMLFSPPTSSGGGNSALSKETANRLSKSGAKSSNVSYSATTAQAAEQVLEADILDPAKLEHLDQILENIYDLVRTAVIAASAFENSVAGKSENTSINENSSVSASKGGTAPSAPTSVLDATSLYTGRLQQQGIDSMAVESMYSAARSLRVAASGRTAPGGGGLDDQNSYRRASNSLRRAPGGPSGPVGGTGAIVQHAKASASELSISHSASSSNTNSYVPAPLSEPVHSINRLASSTIHGDDPSGASQDVTLHMNDDRSNRQFNAMHAAPKDPDSNPGSRNDQQRNGAKSSGAARRGAPPMPAPGDVSGATSSMALMRNLIKVAGFDKPQDLLQWKHLASQLHIPYEVVLHAARARLGDILDELNGDEVTNPDR